MRKTGIILAVIAAVVIVAVVVFWATFDMNRYRGPIQSQLQHHFDRPVSLGPMHLGLFPPRVRAEHVIIGDDPAFRNPRPFIQADEIDISVGLLPLIRRSIEITSLALRRPKVELIKNQQGVWNFSTLGAAADTPAVKESSPGMPFSLNSLVIDDGQVAVTDRRAQSRAVYDHIDAALNDFAPNRQFSVQLSARLAGDGNQEIRFEGTGGPVLWKDVSATPLHGTLGLNHVRVSGLRQFLGTPVLSALDGELSGTTKIDVTPGIAAFDGGFEIQDPRVKNLDLGYTIATQYRLLDNLQRGLLTIPDATVKLGKTALSLTGTVNTGSTPAQLGLQVKAQDLSLAEVSRLAAGFGVALSTDTTVKGRANADIRVSGTTDQPALSGTVSAGDIQVSGKDMAIPALIKSVNLRLTPTDIRSDDFLINYDETTVKSRVSVDHYTSDSPALDADFEAPGAKLPAVLDIAEAYGVTALKKLTGEGTLGLRMHLSGAVHALEGDSILRALDGTALIDFSRLRVSSNNLSREISQIAGFINPAGATQSDFTDISKMTGHVRIDRGVARTDDLKAVLDLGTIGVTGMADLAAQRLNLHVSAVVGREVSQKVGGTAVGGYMKTALANSQGELVIPVLVTGTFQNPRISPDLQVFAEMKLKGLIPDSSNPAAGLASILGNMLSGEAAGKQPGQSTTRQQQAKPTTPNPLQQMLDILSDKKKQPDAPPKPQK